MKNKSHHGYEHNKLPLNRKSGVGDGMGYNGVGNGQYEQQLQQRPVSYENARKRSPGTL